MIKERQSFWTVVYAPSCRGILTRDDLRAIVKKGLERTSGNYKVLVELLNMPQADYKRFLGFLRKFHCHMPFQQFRTAAASQASGLEREAESSGQPAARSERPSIDSEDDERAAAASRS